MRQSASFRLAETRTERAERVEVSLNDREGGAFRLASLAQRPGGGAAASVVERGSGATETKRRAAKNVATRFVSRRPALSERSESKCRSTTGGLSDRRGER